MAGFQEATSKVPDPVAMKEYFVQKREALISELADVKMSYFYQIITADENLEAFVDNKAALFHVRIRLLERRTRN